MIQNIANSAAAEPARLLTAFMETVQIGIVVRDLEAYERFIKEKLTRLKGIASIETSFALDQVKRSEALPL